MFFSHYSPEGPQNTTAPTTTAVVTLAGITFFDEKLENFAGRKKKTYKKKE